jgi:divalent metal cation (Fe/Co/Zn/Cd) transporter
VSTIQISARDTLKQIQRIQAITIAWMSVEAFVSIWAAWKGRSPVLAAFGGDSGIELLSAVVVLWRFQRHDSPHAERRAARLAGGLLFALAAYVPLISVMSLLGYSEPKVSYWGMAILVGAVLIMPMIAREKRRLSSSTGSAALRADAAESALCAYLSIIALLGLGIHAIWHIAWADPVAALVVTPIILYEAREVMRGKACGCC